MATVIHEKQQLINSYKFVIKDIYQETRGIIKVLRRRLEKLEKGETNENIQKVNPENVITD